MGHVSFTAILYIHGKQQNVNFGCVTLTITYKHPYHMYFTGYIYYSPQLIYICFTEVLPAVLKKYCIHYYLLIHVAFSYMASLNFKCLNFRAALGGVCECCRLPVPKQWNC